MSDRMRKVLLQHGLSAEEYFAENIASNPKLAKEYNRVAPVYQDAFGRALPEVAHEPARARTSESLLSLVTGIVAAHVSHNSVSLTDLPELIRAVHDTLRSVSGAGAREPEALTPVVPIRKSVTPEYIVCLEDGKKLKMLKRHLRTSYNMTPDEYRAKWQLGPDYPMVAPNYAKRRSEFAKKIGLRQKARRKKGA